VRETRGEQKFFCRDQKEQRRGHPGHFEKPVSTGRGDQGLHRTSRTESFMVQDCHGLEKAFRGGDGSGVWPRGVELLVGGAARGDGKGSKAPERAQQGVV